MRQYRLITPDGVKDTLFSECREGRSLEKKICRMLAGACYNEVRTPILEFYDVFSVDGRLPLEEMYKLTDSSGKLLVMRPDNTLPVVRLVSSKLKDAPLPVRIYYNQPSFRINQSMKGVSNENPQIGVELIGAGGSHIASLEHVRYPCFAAVEAAQGSGACHNGYRALCVG